MALPVPGPRGRTLGVVVGAVDVRSLAAVASWVAGRASFRVSEGSTTIAARGSVQGGVRATTDLAGRRWEIAVSVAPRAQAERWAAAVVGLVIALAVAALVAQSARREAYARRMLARHLSARQTAQEQFARALAAAPIGMAMLDARGRILRPNAALEEMTGRSVSGSPVTSVLSPNHESGEPLALEATPREGIECRLLGERARWVIVHLTPLPGDDPAEPRLLLQVLDVTGRREAARKLEHLAAHDVLTGLKNRRAFDSALREQHAGRRFPDRRGAVLLVDLDGFKPINDLHGHAAGDEALRRVAAAMAQTLREDDLIGRLGGDEFGVLLKEVDGKGAVHVARTLLRAIADVDLGHADVALSASVGVAMLADHDDPALAADAAMYRIKAAGGGRVELAPAVAARRGGVDLVAPRSS